MKNKKKQVSFYAKASDVKSAFYANQPIFVLLYKEAYFNTNELDESLPSVVVSLLQEYEDVFPNDVPSGLPPITKDPFRGPIYSVFIRTWLITCFMKSMRVYMGVIPEVGHWLTGQCHKVIGGRICRAILFGT